MNSLLRNIAVFVAVGVAFCTTALANNPVLHLNAKYAYVVNLNTGEPVIAKQEDVPVPIASLTKLMTAYVLVTSQLDMMEEIEITMADLKATRDSRRNIGLMVGSKYTREELLLLALMSSSNRAAAAIARTHPAGYEGFVELMNTKALELEMYDSHFVDPSGIFNDNVATAKDLVKLLRAVRDYPLIGRHSTETFYKKNHTFTTKYKVRMINKKTKQSYFRWVTQTHERTQYFGTTNRLLLTDDWDILLQKTGVISAAGYCVTMIVNVNGEDYAMILLNASNKHIRGLDAVKAKYWIEYRVVPTRKVLSKLDPFRRVKYGR
jgi:D-alanyl-D-alanine endopeptidase (penicillin-binding protein 7)